MQNPNDHQVFRPKRLTTQDIRDGCIYLTNGDDTETRVCVVNEELRQGIDIMGTYEKSVTFFGSARLPATDPYYQKAYRLGKRCAELGYAVATGGGPGIMEAANKGAHEVGGRSIGITIQLPMEQSTNPYVNEEIPFYYFFTRKVALAYSAEVYIYFPGGFGTLDELFGILTLSQTNKIPPVPIILVGEKFWEPLLKMSEGLRDIYKTIDATDMNFFTITDDEEKIMEIVKNAPIRKGE